MRPVAPWRSFRLRMTLLTCFLSAGLLVGFGFYALQAVTRISLERMDSDLREAARRSIGRMHMDSQWERVQRELEAAYGAERFSFYAIDPGGTFQSPNWPPDIDTQRFPVPSEDGFDRRRGPRGPGRGFGAPPTRGEGPPRGDGFPGPPGPPEPREYFTWLREGEPWRFCVVASPHATVAIGVDEARFREDVRRVRAALLLALPLALLLALAGSWFISERALRPVRVLADLTERITAQGLHERIDLRGQDTEFQELINVFNGMLERLERGFQQATRFSADAAHELKTPLAVLQGELERGVQEAPVASDEQARYSRLLEQVTRLKGITRKLLLLSLADAGQIRLNLVPVNVTELVESIAEDAAALAPGIKVKRRIAPGLGTLADADLLRQLVQNLVTNALKYNDPDGKIELYLREHGETIQLTVSNTGPGIPPADRDRVFERFYRADKARARASGGAGLGLSLAREIARAHHGDLFLEQTPPGLTAFTLSIPNLNLQRTKRRALLPDTLQPVEDVTPSTPPAPGPGPQ